MQKKQTEGKTGVKDQRRVLKIDKSPLTLSLKWILYVSLVLSVGKYLSTSNVMRFPMHIWHVNRITISILICQHHLEDFINWFEAALTQTWCSQDQRGPRFKGVHQSRQVIRPSVFLAFSVSVTLIYSSEIYPHCTTEWRSTSYSLLLCILLLAVVYYLPSIHSQLTWF